MSNLTSYFPSIGFLGAGNMAGAILRGIAGGGAIPADKVWACDVLPEKLDELHRALKIQITPDPRELVRQTYHVVLAVKPQSLPALLDSIRHLITPNHLLISIAAGITTSVMAAHLPEETRIVRVMPNTPALVGMGAAGVAGGAHATHQDLAAAVELFQSVGLALEVQESDLDAVTALSGSGPAYVFHCMEVMIDAGIEMGLTPQAASLLTLQTFAGAAKLAQESSDDPAELRRKVTSPNGTTAAALAVFEERGLADALRAGIIRARDRSIELSKP